ncbi:hypothetical protein [Candidatus Berkiella aquae]|uniref:Uncharacterized protein n=1 Tax=Candidatus Berkiella aquae TaxID=295108 RepID=A0A0Q9YP27_9GAMM|nr:hypothetical protein [Candidatus Berkiella aquae]MCS5712070.1 hypothetical protein [Candidatus Berkiella aquae]
MKVWKLSPKGQITDAEPGYVRIRAHSEKRARDIAEETFEHSNTKTMIHKTNWADLDWHDTTAIECLLEEDDLSSTEGILDVE